MRTVNINIVLMLLYFHKCAINFYLEILSLYVHLVYANISHILANSFRDFILDNFEFHFKDFKYYSVCFYRPPRPQ